MVLGDIQDATTRKGIEHTISASTLKCGDPSPFLEQRTPQITRTHHWHTTEQKVLDMGRNVCLENATVGESRCFGRHCPGEAPFHSGVAILYHRGPVDGTSAEASPLYTHGPSSDMSPSDPSFITVFVLHQEEGRPVLVIMHR